MSRKEPQVLEAVTAMARIATLAFHPEGSKIAFRNHTIVICPPTTDSVYNLIPKSLLQGIDRYWNSDSRNDLHILNHVIKNFIDLYVIPYRNDDETYKNLINLAKYTCVGLMKLQRTYSDEQCNAVLVIQFYINILRDLIRGNHDYSSFYIPGGQAKVKPIVHESEDLTLSTIFDIEKFKTFWSKKELNRLCGQFNGCFKNQGEVDEVIFSPSDATPDDAFNFLIKTDIDRAKKVNGDEDDGSESGNHESLIESGTSSLIDLPPATTSTTVPLNPTLMRGSPPSGEFTLPEPSNQSLPIVAGMVVSIMKILDTMDQRFTAVLTQSMQGLSKV
jgi:hypothetical protein